MRAEEEVAACAFPVGPHSFHQAPSVSTGSGAVSSTPGATLGASRPRCLAHHCLLSRCTNNQHAQTAQATNLASRMCQRLRKKSQGPRSTDPFCMTLLTEMARENCSPDVMLARMPDSVCTGPAGRSEAALTPDERITLAARGLFVEKLYGPGVRIDFALGCRSPAFDSAFYC